MTIAMPGKMISHGAWRRNFVESVSIVPHSGVRGSGGPRPRNPRPATSMIAVARASVAATMSGVSEFGSMWRTSSRIPLAPTERDAVT